MAPAPELDPRTDVELVEAVGRGPPGRRVAFEALMVRYQDRILRLTSMLLGSGPDAEDTMQEAFIRAYLAVDQWPAPEKFAAWIRRVAMNVAFNFRRSAGARSRHRNELAQVEDGRPAAPDGVAEREALTLVLNGLSYPFREILVLRYVEGLDLAEIAETLDIGSSAAKMRLKRARDEFQRVYTDSTRGRRPSGPTRGEKP